MSWYVPAFELWLHVTIAGLALTAAASLTVLVIRQPARKIRVIQLTLIGLLALPALALLPGYPRVAWWPAASERTTIALEAQSPPEKSGAASAAPLTQHQPLSTTQAPALPGGSSNATHASSAEPLTNQPPLEAALPASAALTALPQSAEPLATTPIPTTPSSRDTTTNPARAMPPAVAAPREPASFTLPSLPDYRLLVVTAYLFGVALFGCWWLIGRVALWRLVRTAVPAEPAIRSLLDDVALGQSSQHAGTRVRLLVSPRAAQPCAFGWRRPTIVLPERIVNELTPDQLRLALSHEWSHVARGDIRTWMLAGLVRLVHFHQPLVWLLRRDLRISQDYLADAAAAGVSTPEDYAELLTTLSRMLRPTPLSPGLGIAPRQSDLYRRVVMLVDQTRPLERTIPRRWNVAAMMLGIALIAGVATLRAEPEESKSEPAEIPTATEALPAARREDADKMRQEFEAEVAKLRDDIAGLRMTRDYLKQQAEKQILTKERDRIRKQIIPIDQQLAELTQKLDNRWNQLASQLAGQTPATNPYEKQETLVTESATKERPSRDDPNRNRSQPFSGRIRPGDILGIEIVGGFPGQQPPTRTVEPDGNVVLGAVYGPASRVNVVGQTLIEAGETIKTKLKEVLEDPQVVVTYEGHNDGVVAEGAPAEAASTQGKPAPAAEPVVLQPLDTIEIILPLKKIRGYVTEIDGKRTVVFGGNLPQVSGTYLIEPDGRIALPEYAGRLKVAGLTEEQAGATLRGHLATNLFPGTALPTTRVLRRGRAVFANGKQHSADYKIQPDDRLMIHSSSFNRGSEFTVDAEGKVGWDPHVQVAGMNLEEAQAAFRKKVKSLAGTPKEQSWPWVISLGGWREEADPRVIDRIEWREGDDVAERAPAEAAPTQGKPAPAAEPVVLQPLDTIELILPLNRTRSYLSDSYGKPGEVLAGKNLPVSGTYVIEPDGRVALPEAGGRFKLAGLTEKEAGKQLREHLSVHLFPRIALPTVTVFRRGRAVFPEGKQPAADYKIAPGDTVLASTYLPLDPMVIDADGRFPLDSWNGKPVEKVPVAGLTLEEAQAALRKAFVWKAGPGGGITGSETDQTAPWLVTLGGWREEADPRVIDLIEGVGATQLLRMQEEMQELKSMIRGLQAE